MTNRNWKTRKWGELATLEYGKGIRRYKQNGGAYRVYGTNGPIGWHDKYLHDQAGIVVGRKGAYRGIHFSPAPFFVIDTGFYLLPKKDFNIKWAYYELLTHDINSMDSGSAIPSTSRNAFYQLPVNIPKRQNQDKIAAVLSAYDDLIENNTRRIKILEDMARTIYREWFVNFRFPGHEKVKLVDSELGKIPEGWEVSIVKDFGRVLTGKTPSKKVSEYYGDKIPFIKTPDLHNNIFCIETGECLSVKGAESQNNKILPPNSISVSCIGTAGIVAITTRSSQTNQQINSIIPNKNRFREFLYFSLVNLKKTIRNYGSTGATMINLSKGKFERLKIIEPTEGIINNFHNLTESLFEIIKLLQLKNANLRQTRDLLLPKLISGELDVSELDIKVKEETS